MKLIEINDKKQLDDFVGSQAHTEFLQSWEWGEFLSKSEGEVKRFGVEENMTLLTAITLVKRQLPLKMNYFYAPRGPIISKQLPIINYKLIDFLFSEIKKIAKKEKAIFLRIEPRERINNPSFVIHNSLDIQPAKTIMLNLSNSEDVLLATMHQKTRYNIRLAEKKGVKIIKSRNIPGLERGESGAVEEFGFNDFWNLMEKTSGRDGFTSHTKEYYEKLLQTAPEIFKLYFAVYENKIISSGIFSFFGDTATYLYGASSDEHREVMAPYLLQWEAIKRAKTIACKYYDFFGIDDKKWPGVTRFKHGFSGEEISYPGTFDVIFNRVKYLFYKILRKLRRLIK